MATVMGVSNAPIALATVLLAASLPAGAESWRVTPNVHAQETWTDNVALQPADQARSELVTEISPGIRIDGEGDRLKLNFDYRLNQLLYARDSGRNNTQNFLSARGTLEAIEDRFFIEARGSISQQSISAFGTRSASSANIDANRTETQTWQVSPYLRGRFGGYAEYLLRYNYTASSADSSQVADTAQSEVIASIRGDNQGPVGWSLDANAATNDYNQGRETDSRRVQGTLSYQFDPQIRGLITAGRESNDFVSVERQSKTTYGVGADWAPTPRTQISGLKERRFFGNGHSFTFRHRTPLSSWSFRDSKDVSALPNQLIAATGRSAEFELFFDALGSQISDPVLRAQVVEGLLQQLGLPTTALLPVGFLTSRVFVDRRREASVALIGSRNTVTLTAFTSDRQALGAGAGTVDDFSLGANVRLRGVSADWGHKLSPLSTISLRGGWEENRGSAGLATEQQSLRLQFSTSVGPRTFGALSARHVRFDSDQGFTGSYRENALTASVSVQF